MMTHMHKAGQGCSEPEETPEILEKWSKVVPGVVGTAANAATTGLTGGNHVAGTVAGKVASAAMQNAIDDNEELRHRSASVVRAATYDIGGGLLAIGLSILSPVLIPAAIVYSLFNDDDDSTPTPPSRPTTGPDTDDEDDDFTP